MRFRPVARNVKDLPASFFFFRHAVGQKCITYYRQVLALCDLPDECGVDHPDVERLFPKDVIARARLYKDAIGTGGTGSYSHSQGVKEFREHVAKFIEARDGHESFAGDIFLTNGASTGIQNILVALMSSDRDAYVPSALMAGLFLDSVSLFFKCHDSDSSVPDLLGSDRIAGRSTGWLHAR